MKNPDDDLDSFSKEALIYEVKKLRKGIRLHRDSSLHELCWYWPKLWKLLPEDVSPEIMVPEWPQFLKGCIHYRQSLDKQSPGSPRSNTEFDG